MKYKRIIILASITLLGIAILLFLKSSSMATSIIWNLSGEGKKLFPLVTISALIDSINPCAFSILLLTIAFFFSLGSARSSILKIGGIYIFGIFTAYFLIGLGILGSLHLFNTPHFMGKLGAILLIVLGVINLINGFFPKFPVKLQIPHVAHSTLARFMEKGSIPAIFILGILVGLCEFPCTGGPYLMILGLLHDHKTYYSGVGYLVWYNVLFILPLAVLLFIASDRALLEKVQDWRKNNTRRMRLWGGIITIILGIVILIV